MLPEHLLLAGIVAADRPGDRVDRTRGAFSLSLLAVTAAAAAALTSQRRLRGGAVSGTVLGRARRRLLAKAIVLALAVPVLLISRDDFAGGAFHILLLSSLYGVCLLLSADSFLTLFLGSS